ncbi:hypothetical protein [Pseudomonas poae]|uniref:Uncharacterized protein n=1 Tax=Pseudomonas poae TaxID=200451 RepID=A0ABY0RFJ0_9PSED|nr:hypothetical protein [Pseudomonas poae]KRP52207.1 hypothetical protein TU75_08415 [Pseudomonas poae]SDN95622.1 hypothetical protein SAMN04490208_2033 [Pseudomonas poae]
MTHGIQFYDNRGGKTLGLDSKTMRAVSLVHGKGLPTNGAVVALPNFDPQKGVVMVEAYGIEQTIMPGYSIMGAYPNASLKFDVLDAQWAAAFAAQYANQQYSIMAVHYK